MPAISDILTVEEAAAYLKVPAETVEQEAAQGRLPGRRIGAHWRFLRAALDDWLRGRDGKTALLEQAGVFANDETLPALRDAIDAARGRPEVEVD